MFYVVEIGNACYQANKTPAINPNGDKITIKHNFESSFIK